MADRRPLTLSIDSQLSNIGNDEYLTEMNLERRDLFTSYRNPPVQFSTETGSMTSPSLSVASVLSDDDSLTSTIREEYQVRTLGTHNIARLSILPIFPSVDQTSRTPCLLLSNVPSKVLNK